MEKKASVDIPNFAGNTAFLAANTRNYHSISKLLAENGADTRGLMPPEELTSVPKVGVSLCFPDLLLTQSVRAAEYTNCISAEG